MTPPPQHKLTHPHSTAASVHPLADLSPQLPLNKLQLILVSGLKSPLLLLPLESIYVGINPEFVV